MGYSDEWTEWQLTPRGWERGSERTDGPGIEFKEPPADRVLTYRWSEIQSSPYSRMHRNAEVKWKSNDEELIAKLKTQFGEAPRHL
jgi:hypothetical protein